MQIVILAIVAFLLGSIPFSVIMGRIFLGKDITRYGDGNPGVANLVRAGNFFLGFVCTLFELGKGMLILLIGHWYLDLSPVSMIVIGTSSILGHAYSPFLKFKGGKSITVTFGTLIGMLEASMLIPFTAFVIAGAISLKNHSWAVMMGPIGTVAFLLLTHGEMWKLFYMIIILVVFIIRQNRSLLETPGLRFSGVFTSFAARFRP